MLYCGEEELYSCYALGKKWNYLFSFFFIMEQSKLKEAVELEQWDKVLL